MIGCRKQLFVGLLVILALAAFSLHASAAPCPTEGYASVMLRGTNVDNNLSLTPHWGGGDGNTSSTTSGDLECRSTVGNYMYFQVGDGWMKQCNQTMYLEVTYFDDKSSGNLMQPQYDSTGAAYTAGSNWNFSGTNIWRTATWTLNNCLFNNRQNNNSDLRVYTSATVTKFASVRVSTVAFNETNFPTASLILGNNEQYHGILHPRPVDGQTTITDIGGRTCRSVTHASYPCMYFNVADSIWYDYQTTGKTLYLKVVYYDNGTDPIHVQYDSRHSDYHTHAYFVNRTNTNTWKTAYWELTDVRFANRQNGSADFRLHFGQNNRTHYISEVHVSKDPFPVDTTPPSVPQNVQAGGTQPTIRKVTWNASTDDTGVAGYKVWRNEVYIGSTSSLFYTDIDRAPSTTYSYRVSAYDAQMNESAKSAVATTTTPAITNFPRWRWEADNLTGTVGSRTSNFTDGGVTFFDEWRSGTNWNWTLDSGNGWITGTGTGGRGFLTSDAGNMAHGFNVNTGVTITARVKPINPSSEGTLRFFARNDSTVGLDNVGGGQSNSTDLWLGWDTGNQIVFYNRGGHQQARWVSTVPFTNEWSIWTLSAKRSGNTMVWKVWINGEYQNTLTYQFNTDSTQSTPISAISIGRRNAGDHETVWDWISITNQGEIEGWDGAGGAVPSIKTQNVTNQERCESQSVTWSVDAVWGDTAGMSYQWKKLVGAAWQDLSGKTSNTLTIDPIGTGDAGQYKCTITNNYGSCDSATATLTVNPLPSFTSHPSNETQCVGQTAAFSVTASNATSYQWQVRPSGGSWSNVTGGSGGTTSSYTTPTLTAGDNEKEYRCRVTNSCGTVDSNAALLTVNTLPVAPTSAGSDRNNFCADDSGNISLSVTGGSGTTCRWFTVSCGGTEVGTGNPLVIASPMQTTTYYARWENDCGNSTCVSTEVTVVQTPVAPTSASANPATISSGQSSTLSYVGGSGGELKWYKGGCGSGDSIGSGLNLLVENITESTTYYCRWESAPCDPSACASVTVTVSLVTIGESKQSADNTPVTLLGKLVSAVFSDHFYIIETNGSSGIRVTPVPGGLAVGDSVDVSGTISTTDGERVVVADTVNVGAPGQLPQPEALSNRAIGGVDENYNAGTGAGQRGVEDGIGSTNNIGLLIKTSGTVTAVGQDHFYIDDGSNAKDFSVFRGLRVKCDDLNKPTPGDSVSVTGISSITKVQDRVFRSIRPRTGSDIKEETP